MRRILPSSITSYSQYGHLKIPKDIKSKCPKCGKISDFILKNNFQENKIGLISNGTCDQCQQISQFIILLNQQDSNMEPIIFVYEEQNPFYQLENKQPIPEDLIRAYRSALNVHNMGDTAATAVMTKRVLEGIAKSFLQEKAAGKKLAEQLSLLAEQINFAKPLQQLSKLVTQEQQLTKTLELELEPDEETADLLIELLNLLIDYLFILPARIDLIYEGLENKWH